MKTTIERAGELLFVTGRGVLTPETTREMMLLTGAAILARDVRAIVCDLRGVVSAMDLDEWAAGLPREVVAPVARVPCAYVVSPVDYDLARARCVARAREGVFRGVFIGPEAAFAWASKRREHWRHPPAAPTPPPASARLSAVRA